MLLVIFWAGLALAETPAVTALAAAQQSALTASGLWACGVMLKTPEIQTESAKDGCAVAMEAACAMGPEGVRMLRAAGLSDAAVCLQPPEPLTKEFTLRWCAAFGEHPASGTIGCVELIAETCAIAAGPGHLESIGLPGVCEPAEE